MAVVRSKRTLLFAAGVILAVALLMTPLAGPVARADTGTVPSLVRTIGGPGHAVMYPSGLEFSAFDDTLVVADTGNHKIEKFDAATGALLWAVGGYGTALGKFSDPRDVGVGTDGSIYVADTGNTRIVKLDANGTPILFWKGPASETVGSPIGISVHQVGGVDKVYVADGSKLSVRTWNAALTTQLESAHSNESCVFSNVRDADADSDGNIYVANYLKNDILKLQPDGTCITKWGSKGTQNGLFKNPYGVRVAVDPEDGAERVYVADSNNNRVQVFSKTGTYVDKVGTFSSAVTDPGTFTALRRVAVDPEGGIWGADLWGYDVEHASVVSPHAGPGGAYLMGTSIPSLPAGPPTQSGAVFNEVRQVAWDNAGNLLAMDSVNQRVVKFNPADGTLLPPTCGKRGWEAGAFNWPRGIAVDPVTNKMWIADTKQNQVQILDFCDTTHVQKIPATTTSSDKFNWPHALAIRPSDGTVWVADTKNNRLKVYSAATRALLFSYGTKGSSEDQFLQPKAVAFDPADPTHVLVADTNNNRIVELVAPNGITSGNQVDWDRSRKFFKKPSGIARDLAGRTFVADSMANRFVILDPAANWGTTSTNSGILGTITQAFGLNLNKPEQVAIGPDGRIYLSDTYNDRILVYEYP
jgi:DNA-binding beta-propeller fold protein YncE